MKREEKKRKKIWIILLIAAAVVASGIIGVGVFFREIRERPRRLRRLLLCLVRL